VAKARDPWAVTESCFCVMELVQDRSAAHPSIAVVLSVPGREGTFVKRWKTIQGRIDADQALDLITWVQSSANNALLAWTGTQAVLPME